MSTHLKRLLDTFCIMLLTAAVAKAQTLEWRLANPTFNATDPDGAGPATGISTFVLQIHTVTGTIPDITGMSTGWSWQSLSAMLPAGPSTPPFCGTNSVTQPANITMSPKFSALGFSYNNVNECSGSVDFAVGDKRFDRRSVGTVDGGSINLTTDWVDVFTVTLWSIGSNTNAGYVALNSGVGGADGPFSSYAVSDVGANEYIVQSLTFNTPLILTTSESSLNDLVVSSFTLINADTDKDIKELKDGDIIDLSTLSTTNLTVRANTRPATIGSVAFQLSGPVNHKHTENSAPYALLGNNKQDYYGMALKAGNYNLTATPYEKRHGGGKKGTVYNIAFTVVDNASIITQTGASNQLRNPLTNNSGDKGVLYAVPNPSPGQTNISFSVPHTGYTILEVFNMNGSLVTRLYNAQAEAGQVYRLPFNSAHLPGGVYMLRLVMGSKVLSYKLVLMR